MADEKVVPAVDGDLDALNEIALAMKALRLEVRAGKDLRAADSEANIAGKELKAYQMKLARQLFSKEMLRFEPVAIQDK